MSGEMAINPKCDEKANAEISQEYTKGLLPKN